MKVILGKNDTGNEFPAYDGKLLPWAISLTLADEAEGYPRARTVITAMRIYRPEQLERERREMIKASFDKFFGHNARTVLKLIDYELSRNPPIQGDSLQSVTEE